jgi:hypothetical protein
MATSRYGGTVAPCDDAAPCEVGARTGFCIRTTLAESTIAGAGLGRFAAEAAAENTVLRRQRLDSSSLRAFCSAAELTAAFPHANDLCMLSDFAFCSPTLPGVVMLDSPPTMVNHAGAAGGANTAFRFFVADNNDDGGGGGGGGVVKEVVATRAIAPGDEFLQDYRAIAKVDWFEQLLATAELVSARELGNTLGEC